MSKFLLLSLSIIVYKLVINFSRYLQVKQEFERYKKYLKDSKWEFTQHTPKIIRLFKDANIKDNVVHTVEPVGYGQLVSGNISVFDNIANRREDVVESVYSKFHQAIGIYRSRMWDAINLKNLQNSYPRRKRTGYYGILPLRVQIFLNARNPRSKLRGIQRRINPLYWVEFILMLPKQLLKYLGVQPESAIVKVFQMAY